MRFPKQPDLNDEAYKRKRDAWLTACANVGRRAKSQRLVTGRTQQ